MSIEDPQEVPEQWRQHFKRQSIEFTYRDLDRNVEGVALNTIRRALQGIGSPSRRVSAGIAKALGITVDEFNATRARVTGDEPTTPFTLPTSADRLNKRERDAVLSIVVVSLAWRSLASRSALTHGCLPQACSNTCSNSKRWV